MGISLVGYITIHGPRPPRPPKVTVDLKILFVKIFSLKQKTKSNNQILPATTEKIKNFTH